MIILQIDSVNRYEPRPDFQLCIQDDGTVLYDGHYFVGVVGKQVDFIGEQVLREIYLLSDFLMKRNQKNYLKKNIEPVFNVKIDGESKLQFEIDKNDVVSGDIIRQILDLSGAREWVKADLDLYMVMSRPGFRSKELILLRASDENQAISICLENRGNRSFKSADDFIAVRLGHQEPDTIVNPVIYFYYSDYKILNHAPTLFLNQGPVLEGDDLCVFLFISFGKRYNDPGASYFMVLGKDKENASQIFKKSYPHFMPRDFQQVDLKVDFVPNPLFETHIPIAIR